MPKLFKFGHFVTSLLIAYYGLGTDLRRLDCLNTKTFSHAQSHFCRWYTNEIPHVKRGWSVIWRAQARLSEKNHAVAGGLSYGSFLKVVFSHGAIHFKIYMSSSYI